MRARVQHIELAKDRRVICVSDIHGSLDLFKVLLEKAAFSDVDELMLLGDLYTKGRQCHETLRYIISLSERPNVHPLRGNCDWLADYLTDGEKKWIEALPHIIESRDYIFVHGGLKSERLCELEAEECMKNDNFMEQGMQFSKYVVTGHWPTHNYRHRIHSANPIVDKAGRIIAIDGGNVINNNGQLNAFIIQNGEFSSAYVDGLPEIAAPVSQEESGGTLNITWLDRFVEPVESGDIFTLVRHLLTGKLIKVLNNMLWTDGQGRVCAMGTDYFPRVEEGEKLSLCGEYPGMLYIKKDGITGWLKTQPDI